MSREIKINAWLPKANLMLKNIAIDLNGMISIDVDEFQSYIDGLQ